MPETDYLIKNCKAEDFEYTCPKLWSEPKPSLTAAVRHCDHCDRKVCLCKTDADIKLYTSVTCCIAIAETKTLAELERELRSQATIPRASPSPMPSIHGVRMMDVILPQAVNEKRC